VPLSVLCHGISQPSRPDTNDINEYGTRNRKRQKAQKNGQSKDRLPPLRLVAKIFLKLNGRVAGSAAAPAAMDKKWNANISRARRMTNFDRTAFVFFFYSIRY
jgi:hypothetical protein